MFHPRLLHVGVLWSIKRGTWSGWGALGGSMFGLCGVGLGLGKLEEKKQQRLTSTGSIFSIRVDSSNVR